MQKTCGNCGLSFLVTRPENKNLFCSHKCYSARRAADLRETSIERFWERVAVGAEDECWEWRGCVNKKGYGEVSFNGSRKLTHRVAFEIVNGPLNGGLFALHHCDNPPCCNPKHLFSGTQAINMADMDRKERRVNAPRLGANHHKAKISDHDVLVIRSSVEGTKTLSDRYGVSYSAIQRIRNAKSWRHVQ